MGIFKQLAGTYKANSALIGTSIWAGLAAFPVSWAVCASVYGVLATPAWNPVVGIVTSFVVYIAAFYFLSRGKRTLRQCFSALGVKELAEYCVRYGVHFGLMMLGVSGLVAAPTAQLVAGTLGHLAVPLLFGRRGVEKKR